MIPRLDRNRAQAAQKFRASSATFPAPVGGWNARDSLAAMDAKDAVYLVNWEPFTTDVRIRKGTSPHAGGMIGQVETLMVYSGPTSNKLFSATNTGRVYNTTTVDDFLTTESGEYLLTEDDSQLIVESSTSSLDISGLSNGRWQYINITTAGGSYLQAVNGDDKAIIYDGSAWHRDGDGVPYNITGVDSADCVQINSHKGRTWLIENNSLKAWYLAVGALGGAATSFNLTSVAQMGGYLVAMATWTIDAGYGMDDLAVFLTSNGEIIVYRGTDPSSATTWALVGIFQSGAPVGRRPFQKYAGDLLVISQDGVVPLSGALQSSRTNPRVALTDKIQSAVSQAVSLYGSNFGWELVWHPKENRIALNVPVNVGQNQQQYVMNNITKAWCNFTNWNANCWAIFENDAYFGGNETTYKAWDGYSDSGLEIETNALQAFNYLGSPGTLKRVTLTQPIVFTNGSPFLFGGVNVDFNLLPNPSALSLQSSAYAQWDSGAWDTAIWGPEVELRKAWQGAVGIGQYFAPTLNSRTSGIQLQWVSTTIVSERGGIM